MDVTALITSISAAIKTNGVQAITGAILQEKLLEIVNALNSGKEDAGTASSVLKEAISQTEGESTTQVPSLALLSAVKSALNTLIEANIEAIATNKESIEDARDYLDILLAVLALYDIENDITLSLETSGKYVDTSGNEVSNSSYGISAEFSVTQGNIYLFPAADTPAQEGVSLYAQRKTRSYPKIINYSYTYDSENRIATATADYDTTLVYTYAYDSEGNATITDASGNVVSALPTTRDVTESIYVPLFNAKGAVAVPIMGYYVYPAPFTGKIVVSASLASIEGAVVKERVLGIIRSIANNYVGTPGQKVIAQAFAELYAAIDNIGHLLHNAAGDLKARSLELDAADNLTVAGFPIKIYGAGSPSATTIPMQQGIPAFKGQEYFDTSATTVHKYIGLDTTSVSDWHLIG